MLFEFNYELQTRNKLTEEISVLKIIVSLYIKIILLLIYVKLIPNYNKIIAFFSKLQYYYGTHLLSYNKRFEINWPVIKSYPVSGSSLYACFPKVARYLNVPNMVE